MDDEGCPSNMENECICDSFSCKEHNLSRELDTVLHPKIIFRKPALCDKIWPIFTNKRMSPATLFEILAEYQPIAHCGLTWPANYVAYRCRTCSDVPGMSICADCFHNGNHKGHDYNMFKSGFGGACDCGFSVMKESGHCMSHGKNAKSKRLNEQIPKNLICAPKRAMPRLIHRLAIQLRRSLVDFEGETEYYLDFLTQLSKSSAVIRGMMIDVLLSDQIYCDQIKCLSNHHDEDTSQVVKEGLRKLRREMRGLTSFKVPEEWNSAISEVRSFSGDNPISCFLDEFIFWMVVYEFPEKLICLFISFFTDDLFKKVFSIKLIRQYPRIATILARSKPEQRRQFRDNQELIYRRILTITSQLTNDADLTKLLCEQEKALHVLVYCLRALIEGGHIEGSKGVLKDNPLSPRSDSICKVVCCDQVMICDRHLENFTSEIRCILDFDFGVQGLVDDIDLMNCWLAMVSYFETMSPCKRELNEHTLYETGPDIPIFGVEFGFCLSQMWSILDSLRDTESITRAKSVALSIHRSLSIWFHKMSIGPNTLLDPYHMSFHVPLHRMFASTLRHLLYHLRLPDREIFQFLAANQEHLGANYGYKPVLGTQIDINISDFFKILLLHPLQAMTLYYEIRCGMWTRNGPVATNQAISYAHTINCHSTIDLDMFLIRYCASKLNPNQFLKTLMSRFHSWILLSFKTKIPTTDTVPTQINRQLNFHIQPDQVLQMLDSSLLLIVKLLTVSCGITDREQLRQEIIAMISVSDRTYSYLFEMLPNRDGLEASKFEGVLASLLDEIAVYKPAQHGSGGSLQQGCYTLKSNIWEEEYDPIQVQYRYYQKRDYQASLDRFYHHSRKSELWPPLKIPKKLGILGGVDLSAILKCQSLIGIIYSLLYKSLYTSDLSETIMAYAIHLLELAVRASLQESSQAQKFKPNESFNGKITNQQLVSAPAEPTRPSYLGKRLCATTTIDSSGLYPVVKEALDLAFDTTWFPFESVLDNCLVFIEDVHSMPLKEFHALINDPSMESKSDTEPYTNQTVPDLDNNTAFDVKAADIEAMEAEDYDEEIEDTNQCEIEIPDDAGSSSITDDGTFSETGDASPGTTLGSTYLDHTYSASNSAGQINSPPLARGPPFSLIPIRSVRGYADNLVSERRAIQASESQSMIESPLQPLALEDSSSETGTTLGQDSAPAAASSHQSLSEVDIQARFMGFFQSRMDGANRPASVTRRAGYIPFSVIDMWTRTRAMLNAPHAIHNPNSIDEDSTIPQTTSRGHQTAGCVSKGSRRERRVRHLRRNRIRYGDSLLTLLLRLHSKYCQQTNCYQYDPQRGQQRTRIGGGLHYVTIALDLICSSDEANMVARVNELQSLIWTQKDSGKASDRGGAGLGLTTDEQPMELNDATERRRRAKELQSKLMAEFASKRRAFIEKYDTMDASQPVQAHTNHSIHQQGQPAAAQTELRPINLSSKLDASSSDTMDKTDKNRPSFVVTQVCEPTASKRDYPIGYPGDHTDLMTAGGSKPKLASPIECCICGTEGSNPLGQVVLLQSSSVFGHSHLRPSDGRKLPCEESQLAAIKSETYAKYVEHRIDLLCENFPQYSWLDSINIGAEGGVHVQTCGHYLHIECHQSYIKSLGQEDLFSRVRSESGEFLCPVCRQLANSVLPILRLDPSARRHQIGAPEGSSQTMKSSTSVECQSLNSNLCQQLDEQCRRIGQLLARREPPDQRHLQSSAAFCAQLTKATGPQYRVVRTSANMHSLFLFLGSIARTNIESELIVRSTPSAAGAAKRSCLKLLFHVLAVNAQTLITDRWFTCDQIWSHLTLCIDDKNRLGVKPNKSEVPLLLRDPSAMLLQFLFAATTSQLCAQSDFRCLVQMLFNLNVIQSIAIVLSYLRPAEARFASDPKERPNANAAKRRATSEELVSLVESVARALSPMLSPQCEEPLMNSTSRVSWLHLKSLSSKLCVQDEYSDLELFVKLLCLPYLRAAALLQHHLYESQFPQLEMTDDQRMTSAQVVSADFDSLVKSLNLANDSSSSGLISSMVWPAVAGASGDKLIASWANEMLRFGGEYSIAARSLLICRPLGWFRPALMRLPHAFDDIFLHYYRRPCTLCAQVPKDVAVCLVCGAPICFRVPCCKDRSRSSQVHSQQCGANTAVFLAIHTSSIVVVRGLRACVWGSVYLDAHDEEDIGLQRGKPLYLVAARFELLESQWLTHSFDHTFGRRWINLPENH